MANLRYLDLFAGAGGLSEGFIRAGFMPVSHVEMDTAACYTLKTRLAYKWLQEQGREQVYNDYLNGDLSRAEFYAEIPDRVLSTVLNYEISWENIEEIFKKVDENLNGKKIDLIVGGPPCQAYSLIGRARDENSMLGDKRNYLYILYGEFLKKYNQFFYQSIFVVKMNLKMNFIMKIVLSMPGEEAVRRVGVSMRGVTMPSTSKPCLYPTMKLIPLVHLLTVLKKTHFQ